MSTLKDGEMCMECREIGRCGQQCITQGGGSWFGTGTRPEDAQNIVTPCFMPNGERGVRLTLCQTINGARITIHNQYSREAGGILAALIQRVIKEAP